MQTQLIKQVEPFIQAMFQQHLDPKYVYHNINHTKYVVEKTAYLIAKENIEASEAENLMVAAWFHDAGYIDGKENHEDRSAELAEEFLLSHNIPQTKIKRVKQVILTTKCDLQPESLADKILRDADCAHLADSNYSGYAEIMRQELNLLHNNKIDKLEWLLKNIDFFKNHQFLTYSAINEWLPQKENNLYKLYVEKDEREKKKAEKENRPKKFGRGVETMFRVALKNHIELSAIADSKANILLSVNAIIISVALSTLLPKLDSISNSYLIWPTFTLLIFSVVSIVMSILSTRPNVSKIKVTRDMVVNKQTNILFFGNFYKMKLDDFEWGIEHLIENKDVLYNSLIKDLYYLGLVLERKYRLLRITYNVFMAGIVLSALAFVVGFVFFAQID